MFCFVAAVGMRVCTLNIQCVPCGLQEQGLDTVDANRALGLPDDCREYTSVRNILKDLQVESIQLMVSFHGACRGGCGGNGWAGRLATHSLPAAALWR